MELSKMCTFCLMWIVFPFRKFILPSNTHFRFRCTRPKCVSATLLPLHSPFETFFVLIERIITKPIFHEMQTKRQQEKTKLQIRQLNTHTQYSQNVWHLLIKNRINCILILFKLSSAIKDSLFQFISLFHFDLSSAYCMQYSGID